MEFRVSMSFFLKILGKQKFVTAVSSSLGVLFSGSPLNISMNSFPFKCYEFMSTGLLQQLSIDPSSFLLDSSVIVQFVINTNSQNGPLV